MAGRPPWNIPERTNECTEIIVTASLTSRTFKGLKWSSIGTVTIVLLQIGFTAILARLVGPHGYGLLAMANVVIRFGSYFAELGVGSALVQKHKLDERDVVSVSSVSVLLGFFFFTVLWLLAPILASSIFKSSEIVPIVRVSSLALVLGGFSITSTSLLRRTLRFRDLALIEISAFVVGYGIIGIPFALNGYGAWSIVYATLAQSALVSVLAYGKTRHAFALNISFQHVKQLYSYGSRISLVSFFEFIGEQLDTMFIGRSLGSASLGIYNRAFMLVYLPMYHVNNSIVRVLFPSFSRVQFEPERLRNAYVSLLTLISTLLIPFCGLLFVSAREIVFVLLGSQFQDAVPIVQILAIAIPLGSLHFGGPVCDALARLNQKLTIQVSYLCILVVLFMLLGPYGLPGYAFALLLCLSLRSVAYICLVTTILHVEWRLYAKAYLFPLRTAAIIAICVYAADIGLQFLSMPRGVILTLKMVIGTLIFVALTFRFPNAQLRKEMTSVLTRLLSAATPVTLIEKYLAPYLVFLTTTNYQRQD